MGKGKRRLKSPDVLLSNVHGSMGPLLPALFESPVMGVALFDSQIRFRAVNEALSAMNGLPVSSAGSGGRRNTSELFDPTALLLENRLQSMQT